MGCYYETLCIHVCYDVHTFHIKIPYYISNPHGDSVHTYQYRPVVTNSMTLNGFVILTYLEGRKLIIFVY